MSSKVPDVEFGGQLTKTSFVSSKQNFGTADTGQTTPYLDVPMIESAESSLVFKMSPTVSLPSHLRQDQPRSPRRVDQE